MYYMTALQPISIITGRVIAKHDCTMKFLVFLTGSQEKRGCPLIRACSLIRSNTVVVFETATLDF